MADCFEWVLSALLVLPSWYLDRKESPQQRAVLYSPVVATICAVTENQQERAFLATQAYAETKLARYVLENRCPDGPPGARCDEGRATGPWQVHRFCAGAWLGSTSASRLRAGAICALRGYRWGVKRCGHHEGGFVVQRGRAGCRAAWAARRVVLMRRVRP